MARVKWTIRVGKDTAQRVHVARGDVPLNVWVVKTLEKALGATESGSGEDARVSLASLPPAPSRASKVEKAPAPVQRPGSSEPLERLKDTGMFQPARNTSPRNPRVKGPIEKGR